MKSILTTMLILVTSCFAFSQTFKELLDKGDEYFLVNEFDTSIIWFTQAIEKDETNSTGYWYRGDAYVYLERYEEAIADYNAAIELDPSKADFYKKRGGCYYHTEQFELSEKDYSQSIELDPSNAEVFVSRADVYIKTNNRQKACSDYQKAYKLEDKGALKSANAYNCDWSSELVDKECKQEKPIVDRVEVDPFTGSVFISKGLKYTDFEIKPKDDWGYITGSEFTLGQEFVVKILTPQNFCQDSEGNINFGTGFAILDNEGTSLGGMENIYGESETTYPPDLIKSLSLTLTISDLELDSSYLLKARFYDKRGEGEVLVNMPLTIKSEASKNANILTTESSLGLGISSAAVDIEIDKLDFVSESKEVVSPEELKSDLAYFVNLSGIQNCGSSIDYTMKLINDIGEEVAKQTGSKSLISPNLNLKLLTSDLKNGRYILWIKIKDEEGKNIGITVPISLSK
jgi:tetratricopeptide (TPR) repeat protein